MKIVNNEILELLHTKIHALRMLGPSYKPTQFEVDVAKIITEEFKDKCLECKEKSIQYRYAPPTPPSKNFLGGLFGK